MICSPIVRIGLSEVIGSWKIIEMSRPRISRISSSSRSSRLRPSNTMRPFGTRPVWRGNRRMIESAETDLHETARGEEMHVQILHLEQRRGGFRLWTRPRLRFHPGFDDAHVLFFIRRTNRLYLNGRDRATGSDATLGPRSATRSCQPRSIRCYETAP